MSLIPFAGAVQKFNRQRDTQYEIERSLRFNSADSAYFNRTFGTPTNNKIFTISAWVKITNPSAGLLDFSLLSVGDAGIIGVSGSGAFGATYNNRIFIRNGGSTGDYWLPLLRDVSAWYHFVVAIDTTQATQADRAKLWINGVSQASNKGASTLGSNATMSVNAASTTHYIGGTGSASYYSNGYLTEYNFIDGQALDASYFGEFNTDTGVWQPIAYTGSYGTNGFYLDFADNSSTTALGYDAAGSNNWTPNNFSVTAGAGNDSLVDVPTPFGTDTGVGGEVRGNYATLNPLDVSSNTLSNGNLDITFATNSDTNRGGTIAVSTGKWYFEATIQAVGGTYAIIGVTSGVATASSLGTTAYQYSYISSTGNKFNNNSSTAYGNTYTTGDVIGVALDMDNGKVWFSKNGTFQASGNPAAGTNQAFSGLSGSFSPAINARNNSIVNLNCGQRPFAYTAPSGFKALCTQNLPEPTIVDGGDYFNTILYTGTGSSNARTGVGFQPDFVWIKERNGAADHGLYDAVRGVQKQLESNRTTAETTETTGLTAFGSDGFTVGALAQLNTNTDTYVAWNWKANGAGSSNTAGSITSTVSVNQTSGFSIVTWTGGAGTVGHGLGVAPKMVIAKNRTTSQDWYVWFTGFSSSQYLVLNGTSAVATSASLWNGVSPSSTVIGLDLGGTNDIVAYCFAEISGYSAFGSYTGNGSTDGPFVYTGFRPAFVMFKRTDTSGDWVIEDVARSPYNQMDARLFPSTSDQETSNGNGNIDYLSNGFKLRNAHSLMNISASTYIYAAFASNPFKFALAR